MPVVLEVHYKDGSSQTKKVWVEKVHHEFVLSNKDIMLTAVREMRDKKAQGGSALHIADMDEVAQAIEERAAIVKRFIGSGQAHAPVQKDKKQELV
jgi:hypothetical protein